MSRKRSQKTSVRGTQTTNGPTTGTNSAIKHKGTWTLGDKAERLDRWAKTAEPRQIMALRIRQLIERLNYRTLKKKQRKAIMQELWGYGIIPLKFSHKIAPTKVNAVVIVRTDEGFYYDNFEINGIVKTEDKDHLIGYYCPDCLMASNMGSWQNLVVKNPFYNNLECQLCGSMDVKEIKRHNIIGQA